MTTTWHADAVLVDGSVQRDVAIEVSEGSIVSMQPGAAPTGNMRLEGLVIPGLVNVHSHAFHRALRGRVESRGPDFWGWRDEMLSVASALNPDSYLALATAVFCEMALAGITTVGEFHYLHHDPHGAQYSDPNAMSVALIAAAEAAGIRMTLLDTCYLRGGFDREVAGPQVRFSDGTATRWAERVDLLDESPMVRVGAAIHSVRAVPADEAAEVARWSRDREAPLHFHLSEQRAENQSCLAATAMTPTQLLAEVGALGGSSTAIHATHVSADDIAAIGDSGTGVCMCPTTERDLADGIGPAAALVASGSPLSVGSDSHAVIDLFEEARAVEMDARLATGARGAHTSAALFEAITSGGAEALGWRGGVIAVGRPADLITIDVEHSVRLAGADPTSLLDHIVFAATASDVIDVVVAGRRIVERGRHVAGDVAAMLDAAISAVWR